MEKKASTKSSPRLRLVISSDSSSELSERIVQSARARFFAQGFRNVTMDQLATELGVSKKTLYATFPSKEDLLRAVLLDKFQRVDSDVDSILEGEHEVLPALRDLLACIRRHSEEIRPQFVEDIRREAPGLFSLVESRRKEVLDRSFGRIFQEGRKAGVIRKDVSPRLLTEILLGATQSIMNPTKVAELQLSLEKGYSTIISVVLEGALTAKGRAGL